MRCVQNVRREILPLRQSRCSTCSMPRQASKIQRNYRIMECMSYAFSSLVLSVMKYFIRRSIVCFWVFTISFST